MKTLLECKHQRKSFVRSGNGMDGRHRITICEDCGKIIISADKLGIHFDISFHIHDETQIEMLTKWTNYVNDTDY